MRNVGSAQWPNSVCLVAKFCAEVGGRTGKTRASLAFSVASRDVSSNEVIDEEIDSAGVVVNDCAIPVRARAEASAWDSAAK